MLNYGKLSTELVYDLINRDNPGLPVPVDGNNVIIEKITKVTPSAATNNRNTQVRLRGVQGMGFRDSITLYYDRVDLAKLLPWNGSVQSQFVTYTATNLHTALPILFDLYGINLSTWDVGNVGLSGANSPNYTNTFVMTAAVSSPAYVGQTTLRYSRGLPVLDTSIVSDALPALTQPIDPTKNQKCIDLITFGIDFTAYRNLLLVDSSGLPQWAGLRALLDSLNVPAYSAPVTSNLVQDVATSGNQFANKAYDRVVIQTGIDEAGAKGVAYYHYNNS